MLIFGTSTDVNGNVKLGNLFQIANWDRQNQLADYQRLLKQYGDVLMSGKTADIAAWGARFKGTDMEADAETIRMAVAASNNYNTALNGVIQKKKALLKETTGLKAGLKSLGNVAKTVGASLLNGFATAAIGYGISKLIEVIDKQVNAAKYAKEALTEYSSGLDELAEKQKNAGQLVSKYQADYDRLSKGVNMVTGENLSLTEDEYTLFKQINSELANSALASVEGITVAYDAQGQAIVKLSGQMDSLSDAYKTLEQQTRNKIIADLPEVLKNTQKALSSKTDFVSDAQYVNALQAYLSVNGSSVPASAYLDWMSSWWGTDQSTAMNAALRRLYKDLGLSTVPTGPSLNDDVAVFASHDAQIRGLITQLNASMDTTLKPMRDTLKALMENVWDSDLYQQASPELRQFGLSTIDRLGASFFNQSQVELSAWAESFARLFASGLHNHSIEELHDSQTDFVFGKINYGQYVTNAQAQLATFLTDEWPAEFQQLIREAYDLDGNSVYDKAKRRLQENITDVTDEWINSLTADQMQFAMTQEFGRQMTQGQFMHLYGRAQQSERYSSAQIAKDYKAVSDANALLTEAAKTQGYSMSITAEQYEQLAEAGDEYAACVKNVNGYMQLDIEASKALIAKKQEEAKATVEAAKAYKLQQYGENARNLQLYRDVLANTTDLTEDSRKALEDKISALESEQAVIRSDIDAYNRLGSEIEYATSSYKKWLDAQDAPEAGDAYANMRTAMEQIKEGQKSGKIGTAKYKAAVELLVPEGKDVQEYMKTLGEYITEDSDGIWKFVDDMFARGFLSKDANGRYFFMQGVTVEDIAQGLGLTDELTQYMLQALQDYGWNVDLADRKYTSDDVLKEYDKAIANTKVKEEELARVMADANATAAEKAKAQAELAEAQAKENEVAAKVKVVTDGEMTLEEQLQAEIQRWKDAIAELEAINVPVAGVITSFTPGEEANDPNDFVSQLQAFITWYESGKDANDPNDFVAQLHAFIAGYENGVGVSPDNQLVGGLIATIQDYINGPGENADPEGLVNALTAYIANYDDQPDVDPNDLVDGLEGSADITLNPDDQVSDDIQGIEAGDYKAIIDVELNPEQKAAVEAEIKRLQAIWEATGGDQSTYPSPGHQYYLTSYNGQDYEVHENRVSGTADQYEPSWAYNLATGEKYEGDALKALLEAIRTGTVPESKTTEAIVSDANQVLLDNLVTQLSEPGTNLSDACEALGITFDKAVAAYEALYKSEIPADSNAYDELMTYLIEHTRSSSDMPKENPPVVEPKEDQRSLEQKRADFDAAMLETAGDFDAALSKAAVSMDELIAELTASYAKNPYLHNDRPVDESSVRFNANGIYHQNIMHQIEAAVKTAGGDLSVALNELGMSYDQALEHFQQSALSYGIGVKPDEADFGDLQDYLERETQMDVLVGLKTDEATQQLTAFVNEAEKREISLTAKVTGIWNGITGFAGRMLARGTKHARDEDAVVGEHGVETILSGDRFYTVGHNGPEFVHLNEGDQVLTNSETKRLFRGSSVPRRSGRAYGDGTGLFQSAVAGASSAVTAAAAALGALFGLNGKNNTDVTGGGDDQRKKDSNKNRGPDYNAILKKFEQLHDWITRALDVAEKRTQALVDSVKDFVGYMAQNKQLDKALESTRKEIELNQQAYVRYMQQATDVQDQLDLSDEIVQKIHEGIIDIEEYDETTKKKIAEYQEWYNKAEECKDAIEGLKDQEHELQLQRLDNIVTDYDNRLDQLNDDSARLEREIELQKAIGTEVQEESYKKLIEGERQQVATLQRERAALETEFNTLVANGVIQVGSDEWHKYRNEIEGIDEAINDATIDMAKFADEIYNIKLSKLQAVADTLQNIQANTEGIMSLHDAQGAKNVKSYYDALISNGHDQIANLESQNALIREQMEGLEPGSEKYQELLGELRANEQAINDIKVSQEQWNDSIRDLKISDLEDEREALQKTNDEYQRQLEMEEALADLAKAKNQRTKLVYREGKKECPFTQ